MIIPNSSCQSLLYTLRNTQSHTHSTERWSNEKKNIDIKKNNNFFGTSLFYPKRHHWKFQRNINSTLEIVSMRGKCITRFVGPHERAVVAAHENTQHSSKRTTHTKRDSAHCYCTYSARAGFLTKEAAILEWWGVCHGTGPNFFFFSHLWPHISWL